MAFAISRPLPRLYPRMQIQLCTRTRVTSMAVRKSPAVERLVAHTAHAGVEPALARNIIMLAEKSVREWSFSTTDFLTPPESAALNMALSAMPNLTVTPWGGYDDAERTVLLFAHEEVCDIGSIVDMAKENDVMSCVKISGDFEGKNVTHRDLMGAILSCGITRAKMGDIHIFPSGGQVLMLREVSESVAGSLTDVKNATVSTSVLDVSAFEMPERRVKEVMTVESSMRLDSVASAGFKMSRTKMADLAKGGLVRVNYADVKQVAKSLKVDDVVSVRGVGKLKIMQCEMTSKGRFRVLMNRYI